jgi:DGQHR domain-containing protein
MSEIIFSCIPVVQPIGTFYIGAIDSKDLVAISYADVRKPDGRDIERYIGTQRDLSEDRVEEIQQYVTTVDACFPSGVILSINSENAKYDEKTNRLAITRDEKVAKIIDGQHRIAGLQNYNGTQFQVNVTIFIDMDIEDQAMVFATINLKQTKVTKSLAYDLYEYAQSRSPQKTCHNVAKLMNFKEGSPLYQRIKILGKATDGGTEIISQSTFVDRLLKMISTDPMDDRDKIKRKLPLEKTVGRRADNLIFRNWWIEEKDGEIARTVWNYFSAVQTRWPTAWNDLSRGMVLARTTGFAALMRLLPDLLTPNLLNSKQISIEIPEISFFLTALQKSTLNDVDFTNANFLPGAQGENELLKRLRREISIY